MKRYTSLAAALTLLATAAAAQGTSPAGTQTPSGTQSGSSTQGSTRSQGQPGTSGDRQFVEKMLMTNMAEIQLGQLAQRKASSPEVKSFGEQMIAEHNKANQELQPIAQRMGVQSPRQLDAKHKAVADKLTKLQGAEFDRQYMQAMVDGHREALQVAESAAGGSRTGNNGTGSSAVGTSGAGGSSAATAGSTGAGATGASSTTGDAQPRGTGSSAGTSTASSTPGSSPASSGAAPQTATEYASKTAPVIQQHLQHAERVQSSTK